MSVALARSNVDPANRKQSLVAVHCARWAGKIRDSTLQSKANQGPGKGLKLRENRHLLACEIQHRYLKPNQRKVNLVNR